MSAILSPHSIGLSRRITSIWQRFTCSGFPCGMAILQPTAVASTFSRSSTSLANSLCTIPLFMRSWHARFKTSLRFFAFFSNIINSSDSICENSLTSALWPVMSSKHLFLIFFSSCALISGETYKNLISLWISACVSMVESMRSQSYSSICSMRSDDKMLTILTSGTLFSILPAIMLPVA